MADSAEILKLILFNENCFILIQLSEKFVPNSLIDNTPALVHIMAWHQTSDKLLSQPMMAWLIYRGMYATRPWEV